ncbi:MAG: chemotaxis protein CheA [Magnetococcales bacterium]|nr:chemotaxis protein CheA [Magnetococcales bacterium]
MTTPAPPPSAADDPYFQEYVHNFLLSAEEIIQTLEGDILALEQDPGATERIHRIFRGYHTLKGGARGAKWSEMADFAHRVETLLSRLRDGELPLTAEALSLLLRSVDLLPGFLAMAQGGAGPEPAQLAAFLEALEPFLRSDAAEAQQETRTAIGGIVAALRADLPAFLQQPDGEWLGDCYRGLEIIQLAAGAANLSHLADYALQVADRLIPIESGRQAITAALPPLMEAVLGDLEAALQAPEPPPAPLQARLRHTLAALHSYPEPLPATADPAAECRSEPQPLGEILLAQGAVSEADLLAGLARQPLLGDILVQEGKLTHVARDRALATQERQLEQSFRENAATIRVDLHKLNRLINVAGEFRLFQERLEQGLALLEQQYEALVRQVGVQTTTACAPLRASHHALQEIAHQGQQLCQTLQNQVVTLRMIPISGLFFSLQRLVRDAARQTGKLVRLEIRGGNTEVDKNIVEKLGDPFKHLLRNAIDHGIETPEQRQAAGKSPHGTITLEAFHRESQLCVDVADDGRGIDVARVLAVARQKGLLTGDGAEPSPEEILALLFQPGFSTAATVSDLSGRGVGLDVVHQEILALHGRVTIHTHPGEGSRFRIQLPLTLAILDGVIVRVGAQLFILPTLAILTSQPDATGVDGRVVWQGDSLPVLPLGSLLGMAPVETARTALLIVAVAGERVALRVDEIMTQKQLLIKNLAEHFYPVPGVMAASILEDGQVALILDLEWLLRQKD